MLAVESLRCVPMRERGLDEGHVAALAELDGDWAPIVVRRDDRVVIDGQHRVAAARRTGRAELPAVFFDGSGDDGYVEFVRRNVVHGLPLSLDERRHAARRILRSHPEWSDRSIAAVCGLAPKTVARLRECGATTTAAAGRIGRDGRVRPVDAAGIRRRIVAELKRNPDASLRAIAKVVGASPETVRTVRARLANGEPAESFAPVESVETDATILGLLARRRPGGLALAEDRALLGRDGGPELVEWFDAKAVDTADMWRHIGVVPMSRVYEIADEARRRAAFWTEFADALESQVRRRA
jgi:ParB-like chromosome segregation protein Spo0J